VRFWLWSIFATSVDILASLNDRNVRLEILECISSFFRKLYFQAVIPSFEKHANIRTERDIFNDQMLQEVLVALKETCSDAKYTSIRSASLDLIILLIDRVQVSSNGMRLLEHHLEEILHLANAMSSNEIDLSSKSDKIKKDLLEQYPSKKLKAEQLSPI